MTLPDPYARLRTLRESLALAAAPAEEQLAALPDAAWDEAALGEDPRWEESRSLAAAALAAL